MHTIKVAVLLVLTLAALRGASWLLGWLAHRAFRLTAASSAALANLACLAGFASVLYWTRIPGVPFDDDPALLFGAAVYTAGFVMDLAWTPWRAPRTVDAHDHAATAERTA